jgi:hypothetical protein
MQIRKKYAAKPKIFIYYQEKCFLGSENNNNLTNAGIGLEIIFDQLDSIYGSVCFVIYYIYYFFMAFPNLH